MKKVNKGYIFIIIGVTLVSYQYLAKSQQYIVEQNKIKYTIQNGTDYLKKEIKDSYDMVLEIPIINLKKGIYQKDDERNNINQNVTIHQNSDYPDQEGSNVILMAHSGNGEKAYFNDLDQLNKDSLIKVYYHGKLYTYIINDYYQVEKTGTIELKHNQQKKTVTLITCSQKDKTKQLIYIGNLLDEINY